MVDIIPSSAFIKAVKHLDTAQKEKLQKIIRKILSKPAVGKPLKYLRGERAVRVKPFRVVYMYRDHTKTLYLLKFEHRKSAYK